MVLPALGAAARKGAAAAEKKGAAAGKGAAAAEKKGAAAGKKGPAADAKSGELRIGPLTAGLMILTALFIDGLKALLEWVGIGFAVNWIINLGAIFMFWLWFIWHNVEVGLKNLKNMGVFFGGNLFEFIPLIEELPLLTGVILVIIIRTMAEDKLPQMAQKMLK